MTQSRAIRIGASRSHNTTQGRARIIRAKMETKDHDDSGRKSSEKQQIYKATWLLMHDDDDDEDDVITGTWQQAEARARIASHHSNHDSD